MARGREKAVWAPVSSLMAFIHNGLCAICGDTRVKTADDFNPTISRPQKAAIPTLTPEQTYKVLKAVFAG